jgi:hypothetical protein
LLTYRSISGLFNRWNEIGTYIHVKRVPVKVHATLALLLEFALLLDGQWASTGSESRLLIFLWLGLFLGCDDVQQATHEELLVQRSVGLDGMLGQQIEDIGVALGLLGIFGDGHVDLGQRSKLLKQFPEILFCAGIWQVSDKEASSVSDEILGVLLFLLGRDDDRSVRRRLGNFGRWCNCL